ncbi:MAG: LysE family transporter [Candidatus Azobacteroides sp.]|jgi:threonine/homoserine/homoserine lactone efflux protein|nr:LysE family transporter [Candidatus Azobacteroides sp.]
MFHTIAEGLTIGVLVSAPMGPIGLLCIQRTLNKGRWHGFVTGIGAIVSDLLYAVLVGIGMSFLVDFVESHVNILQICGSILLLGFGIYLFRSNPIKTLRKAKTSSGYTQDLATSFFLTLSNPLVILLYIGLFARFSFIVYGPWFQQIVGYLSISAGALAWWFLVTFLIGKLRGKFNLRGLWVVNRTIGIIVIVLSLVGLIATLTFTGDFIPL